jgi:hypothetical protein
MIRPRAIARTPRPAALVAALLLAACGSDPAPGGGGGGGTCPSLAGTWKITAHSCNPGTVGSTLSFVQSNCSIDAIPPWTGWSGSLLPDGTGSWTGPTGPSSSMVCQTMLSGTTIQANCVPACAVTVEKQ